VAHFYQTAEEGGIRTGEHLRVNCKATLFSMWNLGYHFFFFFSFLFSPVWALVFFKRPVILRSGQEWIKFLLTKPWIETLSLSWVWWFTPVIPAHRRLKQESWILGQFGLHIKTRSWKQIPPVLLYTGLLGVENSVETQVTCITYAVLLYTVKHVAHPTHCIITWHVTTSDRI
jgi:hypothetical protein